MADAPKATPKNWREMDANELAAHIEQIDKSHKQHMTHLRAVLRALQSEPK